VPLRMGLHKLGDMAHVDELADAMRDRADAVRDRLTGDADQRDDDEYYDDEEELDDEDFDDEDFDDEDFDDEDDEGFDDEPDDDDGPRGEGEELDDDEALDDEELQDEEEPRAEDDDEEPEAVDDEEDLEPEEEDEELEPEDDDEDEQVAARSLELGLAGESHGDRARGRVPDLFEALRTPHRRAPVMRRELLRVDPATRPPKPDQRRTGERQGGRSKNTKSTAARS
jgi:hypothetical protein